MVVTLSIVIPVFNEAASLPGFLAHLRSVTEAGPLRPPEIIFVDGGSSDGTTEVLHRAGFACISADRGRGSQMNAGAAATGGAGIVFLHADTMLPEDGLRHVADAIERGDVGGFFRVRLDSSRPLLRLVGKLISVRSRLTGVATGDQAIFVQRTTFEALGGYAPLPLFEDVDLSRRIKSHGIVARLDLSVTTSARRWEQLGPWRTIAQMWMLRSLYYCGMNPDRLARYYETAR